MNGPEVACALLAVAALLEPARTWPRRRLAALCPAEHRTANRARGHALPATCGAALGLLALTMTGAAGWLVAPAIGACGYLAARYLLWSGRMRVAVVAPLHLAATWDLLGACLSSGLPVPTAVRAITPDLPEPAASTLRQCADLLALGADPVQAWEPALRHPHTAVLARGARRSARSGTALAGVAVALAAEARAEATDTAEAQAQRAAVLVSGPLGLCFLPAFLCLGVVPVVIGLAGQLSTSW